MLMCTFSWVETSFGVLSYIFLHHVPGAIKVQNVYDQTYI